MIESIKKIIHPESVEYTTITLVILIVGILVKFILGVYVKQTGKKVHSDSLVASGSDAFNDAILSISVLASAILYNLLNWNIEAYMGAILSLFIIKAGLELIKEAVDNLPKLIKSLKFKIILFFIIIIVLDIIFFYYISAFCAIYSIIQFHMISNSLISFLLTNSYSIILSLITSIIRIFSLKKETKTRYILYMVSLVISLI